MKRMKEVTELLMVLAFIVACHASRKSEQNLLPLFDKQGHRGCRGLLPENTIPAMIKAIDLGVTTLEMDVVVTKDKQLILSHEPFFSHDIATKPDGKYVDTQEERDLNIYQMTYAETQQYDVGLKPYPRFPQQQKIKSTKPLLSALIDSVEHYVNKDQGNNNQKIFYNIETKSLPATDNIFHPEPKEYVDLLMQVIKEKQVEARVIIQSFDFRTLQVLHRKYPAMKTAALVEDFDKKPLEDQLKGLGFIPTIYSPHYSLVTEELLKECHRQHIRVIPWTVNEKKEIDRLKQMGVDGVITDYPDLFNQQ